MNTKVKTSKVHYFSLFWKICKKSGLIYIFLIFIILYFAFTTAIFYLDQSAFKDYGDALRFTFSSFFTVGYGDYTVTTTWSRILTVILIIYGAVIGLISSLFIGLITGIFNIFLLYIILGIFGAFVGKFIQSKQI